MKKLILLLLAFYFFTGCNKSANKEISSQKRILHLSFLSDVRSLDPRITNESPPCILMNMIYEGLMHLDLEGRPTFGLAESVEISEDQLTYKFYLRDSVWSNGDPVTAHDFEYAWKKAVDPRFAHTGAFTFYVIKNVSACMEKQVSVDEIGVHAINDKTLEVILEHPTPYFLSLTTCSTYSPINRRVDEKYPGWCNNINDHFVCNGPFIIKKWKKGFEIVLEKNKRYWDARSVYLPGISIQIIPDANTQFYQYQKKEIDWVGQPFNVLPFDITQDKNIVKNLYKMEMVGLSWIFVNTERPPFNNKNIRKAFAYAINRKAITDHIYQLGEVPAYGILNSELSLQEGPYFDDGDIQKARKYLDIGLKELGMKKKDLKDIVFSQRTSVFTLRVTQAIQQQIQEALGIHIEIDQADFPIHFNRLAKGKFSLGEISWVSWIHDPIYMLDTFRKKSFATNMSRWENGRYKECLDKSDYEIDPNKRKKYLQQAEFILMDEMPVIPICFNTLTFLKNSKLKDVYISHLKEVDFRYSYFEE